MKDSLPRKVVINDHFTTSLHNGLALRVYADNRPTNFEISDIHKGLILLESGKELIEEGAGFGLPVAKYGDKSIFPGSAYIEIIDEPPLVVIEKTYEMNLVSIKRLKNYGRISDVIYQPIHRAFTKLYLNYNMLRPLLDWILENRTRIGISTTFKKIKSRGNVKIAYTIGTNTINIKVYPNLEPGCIKLVLLNEQGAAIFRKYSDNRQVLVDRNISAWKPVQGDSATFSDLQGSVSFSITKPTGGDFHRGREYIKERFSWSGLALSFNTNNDVEYNIIFTHRHFFKKTLSRC